MSEMYMGSHKYRLLKSICTDTHTTRTNYNNKKQYKLIHRGKAVKAYSINEPDIVMSI